MSDSKSFEGTLIYCVKDKSKLPAHNVKLIQTKNGKYRLTGLCPNNHKVSQFISKKDGEGILGNLFGLPGGKIPILGDIPIVGSIF